MRGTIIKRQRTKPGSYSWGYIFWAAPGADGKRRQIKKGGFSTKGAAEDALAGAIAAEKEAKNAGPNAAVEEAPTLEAYFSYWLDEHAKRRLAPKTFVRYAELGQYWMRYLGSTPIDKLTTRQIQDGLNKLQDCGGQKTKDFPDGKPLSAKTVRSIGGVLFTALKEAIRLDLLKVAHPMADARVVLPRLVKRNPVVLDPAKLQALFEQVRDTRLYPFIITAAASGARRGELCAVEWGDLSASGELTLSKSLEQLHGKHLRVKSTKSGKERKFGLPEWCLEVLRAHRLEQDRDRELYGADYEDHNLIFATPEGGYYSPDRLGARVVEAMRKVGLTGVSLHSLRHSFASLMLSKGVPIAVVSERLGHSDQNITLAIYSHSMPADSSAAAKVWNDAMAGAIADARKAKAKKPAPLRMLPIVTEKAG